MIVSCEYRPYDPRIHVLQYIICSVIRSIEFLCTQSSSFQHLFIILTTGRPVSITQLLKKIVTVCMFCHRDIASL